MTDFETMTKEEAIKYCFKHRNEFLADCYDYGVEGIRQFDCLVAILESGNIEPKDLPSYGMDY